MATRAPYAFRPGAFRTSNSTRFNGKMGRSSVTNPVRAAVSLIRQGYCLDTDRAVCCLLAYARFYYMDVAWRNRSSGRLGDNDRVQEDLGKVPFVYRLRAHESGCQRVVVPDQCLACAAVRLFLLLLDHSGNHPVAGAGHGI